MVTQPWATCDHPSVLLLLSNPTASPAAMHQNTMETSCSERHEAVMPPACRLGSLLSAPRSSSSCRRAEWWWSLHWAGCPAPAQMHRQNEATAASVPNDGSRRRRQVVAAGSLHVGSSGSGALHTLPSTTLGKSPAAAAVHLVRVVSRPSARHRGPHHHRPLHLSCRPRLQRAPQLQRQGLAAQCCARLHTCSRRVATALKRKLWPCCWLAVRQA